MRKILLTLLGVAVSTIPVAVCALSFVPIWKHRGDGAALSGFALILLLLSFVPLFKLVKKMLTSPAAHTMWLICFILFFCLSKIADEMTVISFVGFVSNLIGAAIFKLADRRIDENEKQI